MRGSGMLDHDGTSTQQERVGASNRTIRLVGKFEPSHGVQSNHPDPVSHQRILSALRGQRPSIGMGDHLGAQSSKHDGPKVMIRMVMGEDDPLHWTAGYRSYLLDELLSLPRTRQRVYHHDSRVRHHEAGVWPPLRSATSVPHRGVHTRRQQTGDGWSKRKPDTRKCGCCCQEKCVWTSDGKKHERPNRMGKAGRMAGWIRRRRS